VLREWTDTKTEKYLLYPELNYLQDLMISRIRPSLKAYMVEEEVWGFMIIRSLLLMRLSR
jgi:hypothetical protein